MSFSFTAQGIDVIEVTCSVYNDVMRSSASCDQDRGNAVETRNAGHLPVYLDSMLLNLE